MNETVQFAETGLEETIKAEEDKFKFRIEDLIRFIFPGTLQHPLAAGRLYCFGSYGPLDENLQIRTGIKGSRVLAVYELEQMCLQSEREDILQIYSHRARDIGLMSSRDQFEMITQADAHLKKANGKASLPQITAKDIHELFQDAPRDEFDRISFHDAQNIIDQFRKDRIKGYKLIYPSLVKKDPLAAGSMGSSSAQSHMGGFIETDCDGHSLQSKSAKSASTGTKTKSTRMPLIGGTVSSAIAPRTMFKYKEGLSNSELVAQTTKYLSKHASKISQIDGKASNELISNIRLLREVPPFCKDPYEVKGQSTRDKWDDTSMLKGTGLGSMVKSAASATTWKRKTTVY